MPNVTIHENIRVPVSENAILSIPIGSSDITGFDGQ
jgi:hypothetical protein